MLFAVDDAAADLDGAFGPRPHVQQRTLALADLEGPSQQRADPQRRCAGRLVLGNALLGHEHARAQAARLLVDPGPAVDEAELVRRTVERFYLGGRAVLTQLHLGRPLRARAQPAARTVLPGGPVAGGRAEHRARAVLSFDQPGAPYQRMTRQRQLAGRSEDAQL